VTWALALEELSLALKFLHGRAMLEISIDIGSEFILPLAVVEGAS
jgi:hypothetical protein